MKANLGIDAKKDKVGSHNEALFQLISGWKNDAKDPTKDIETIDLKLSEFKEKFSQEQQDYAILASLRYSKKGQRIHLAGCLMANGINLAYDFKEDSSLGEPEKLILRLFGTCSTPSNNNEPPFNVRGIPNFIKSLQNGGYNTDQAFNWAMHIAVYHGNTTAVAYLYRVAPSSIYSTHSEGSYYNIFGRGLKKIENGLIENLQTLYATTMVYNIHPQAHGTAFFADKFEDAFKSILTNSNLEPSLKSKLIPAMAIISADYHFKEFFTRKFKQNKILNIYQSFILDDPGSLATTNLKETTDSGIKIEEDLLLHINALGYDSRRKGSILNAFSGTSVLPSGKDIILRQNAAHVAASIIVNRANAREKIGYEHSVYFAKLAKYGINFQEIDFLGFTPLHIMLSDPKFSVRGGEWELWDRFREVINSLKEAGKLRECINTPDGILGKTLLHIAAEREFYKCVDLLVKEEASPHITDKYGKKPEFYAKSNSIKKLLNQRQKTQDTLERKKEIDPPKKKETTKKTVKQDIGKEEKKESNPSNEETLTDSEKFLKTCVRYLMRDFSISGKTYSYFVVYAYDIGSREGFPARQAIAREIIDLLRLIPGLTVHCDLKHKDDLGINQLRLLPKQVLQSESEFNKYFDYLQEIGIIKKPEERIKWHKDYADYSVDRVVVCGSQGLKERYDRKAGQVTIEIEHVHKRMSYEEKNTNVVAVSLSGKFDDSLEGVTKHNTRYIKELAYSKRCKYNGVEFLENEGVYIGFFNTLEMLFRDDQQLLEQLEAVRRKYNKFAELIKEGKVPEIVQNFIKNQQNIEEQETNLAIKYMESIVEQNFQEQTYQVHKDYEKYPDNNSDSKEEKTKTPPPGSNTEITSANITLEDQMSKSTQS